MNPLLLSCPVQINLRHHDSRASDRLILNVLISKAEGSLQWTRQSRGHVHHNIGSRSNIHTASCVEGGVYTLVIKVLKWCITSILLPRLSLS